jgi:hypothetical protein
MNGIRKFSILTEDFEYVPQEEQVKSGIQIIKKIQN